MKMQTLFLLIPVTFIAGGLFLGREDRFLVIAGL